MTDATFWTAHIEAGNQDQTTLFDDTRQIIITAVAGDVYVSPQSAYHPPALDAMSTSDHWLGAIVLEGNTLRVNIRVNDASWSSGTLYLGPVTPSSGSCTVSVVSSRLGD